MYIFFFKIHHKSKDSSGENKIKIFFFYQSVHLKIKGGGVKILSMVRKMCNLNVYICHKSSAVTHYYSFYLYASTYVYY